MKQKRFRRLLSVALVLVMLLSALPVVSLAVEMGTKPADGTTTGNPFPKGTGGSNSFRIPAMVTLNNGTIVAAADARWNTTYDGGGLDTIVSYSTDNGANWNYTFANYLGDNGNTYNGSGSTAFIDPALATDGSTVYMLCDLYPYGVALNGSGNTAPDTAVGFNSDGTLKLAASGSSSYDYYLNDGQIYDSGNNVVSGYTVDAYFNITGTDGTSSNLFFSDSPYQVVRTGYLYLTKSTDGGKTWSEPALIPNVKTASEQVCLVGPGRGLVTGGKIIFPVYIYNGSSSSQRMGFIYSTNKGASWTRVDSSINWSSESAVVELSDGTLRFFYRNGTSRLCYVDYSWTSGWGSAVNTGIATNSNTQISAISYSKTVGGKQVILVSCPTGPNEAGSSSSSANNRLNGKIFVGIVNEDKSISWPDSAKISVPSVNSSNQFMYSCLTELSNGKVAILYEDYQSNWGDGYYTMSFATYDLGLSTDSEEENKDPVTVTDETSNVSVTAQGLTSVSAVKQTSSTPYTGYTASVTYSITLNDSTYTDAAEIKIPYDSAFDDCTNYIGSVANADGTEDTFSVKLVGGYFVGTAPHFSDVTISGRAVNKEENIALNVGETSETFTDVSGNYSGNYTAPDSSIAKINIEGKDGQEGGVEYNVASVTCNDLISSNNSNWTATSGYYYTPDGTNYYPVYAKRSSTAKGNLWKYTEYTYTWGYKIGDLEPAKIGNDQVEGSRTSDGRDATPNITVYTQSPTEAVPASTTVSFTGVGAGETTAVVGSTQYNITVNRKTETVNLSVGNTATYTDASTSAPVVSDSTVASATLSGGTLTIKGLKDGTTTVTTDTAVYTVTVSDGTNISIKENETTTISVELQDGQTVEWSSANSSYVGVAGKYNTTSGAYTNEAILAGQNVTSSPVAVTATIKDADGNVVGTQKWLVTVTEGDADTNTSSKGIYFNIATIEHCTVYYSINGGELIPVNGTGVTTGNWTGNGTHTGHFNIMFFAAPDEGYALTYMYIEGTDGQYYTLTNGNPDGTDSDAWPFVDANASTIPSSSSDSAWKTVNGSLHGFRWALMEGNMTIDQMKVLFSNAIALGCDGVTTQTKNSTSGIGSASDPMEVKFVAQKLPTVAKTIKSITRNGTETAYTEGMKVELGDTINYSVVVTRYATNANYGTITYDKEKLTDELTNNNGIRNPDMGTSTTSDKTYTYTTSLTLTMDNFAKVVKDGKITNTAEFSYSYSSQYSAGSLTSDASAVAEITVNVPEYVIDFGLPVTIDLSKKLGGVAISEGTAKFGTVTGNGTSFTYTPTKVLTGKDHVTLTLANGQSYGVNIIPASNVLYEDSFLTVNPEISYDETYLEWKTVRPDTADSNAQTSDQETRYGYDIAYANSTNYSQGTSWSITGLTSSTTSQYLTTSFYGTGFDLIGTAGPNTGNVYLLIQGPVNKLIIVDTSYVDGGVTLYQVPLAHVEGLTEGLYTVNILAGYRAASGGSNDGSDSGSNSSGSTRAAYSLSSESSAIDDIYAVVDKLLMDGLDFDDYELVYADPSSALAELDNSRATYVLDTGDSNGSSTTGTTVPRPEGNMITIDGFRVYGDTAKDAYTAEGEYGATYTNVLDAMLNNDNGSFTAYAENQTTSEWTQANYEGNGGPQNEVYLAQGHAIVFKVNAGATVQISSRAAKGTPNLMVNGTVIVPNLVSNTEMYYNVTATSDGIVTIQNNVADSLLALGNLKMSTDIQVMPLSLEDEVTVFTLLRMAPAPGEPEVPEEPEETEVFTPEKLNVSVKSFNVIRNKLVTVTVNASTDVEKLTINGQTVKPMNSLLVKRGWSKEYIYVFTDTVKRGESKSYEIVAYDADGLASEPKSVTG